MHFVGPLASSWTTATPITVLAACTLAVTSFRDGSGSHDPGSEGPRRSAITELGLTQHVFLSSMVAHVGLDPRKDVNFVEHPAAEGKRPSRGGRSTAYSVFRRTLRSCAPEGRTRRRHSAVDRPWSQYFCCLATGHREFVRKHPVRPKRRCGRSERGRPLRPRT